MIVVCDTSPVNYLVLIDGIDLLPQLFTTVVLPAGVLAELQHPRTPPRVASWARQLPPWVLVISPKGPVEDVGLGRGEAEAIAIAAQVHADAVLIDERGDGGGTRSRSRGHGHAGRTCLGSRVEAREPRGQYSPPSWHELSSVTGIDRRHPSSELIDGQRLSCFRAWNTCCGIAAGRHSRSSDSP